MGVKRTCKTTDGEQLFCKRIIQDSQSEASYITFLAVLLYSIGSNIVNAANTYFYTYIFEDLTLASIITLITCVTDFSGYNGHW